MNSYTLHKQNTNKKITNWLDGLNGEEIWIVKLSVAIKTYGLGK